MMDLPSVKIEDGIKYFFLFLLMNNFMDASPQDFAAFFYVSQSVSDSIFV